MNQQSKVEIMVKPYLFCRNIFIRVGLLCLLGLISGVSVQAKIVRQDAGVDERQDVQALYEKAVAAFEKREYNAAESYSRQVLEVDSLFQEASGRSAWYWLGLSQEKQEEPFSAVETFENGLTLLKSAGLTDLHIHYDLARVIGENDIEDHESDITGLMVALFENISPNEQPDLWQRIKDEMGFLLDEQDRKRLEEALKVPGGKPERILHVFFRKEDPNPITVENELFAKIFQRAKIARNLYRSLNSSQGYDARGEMYVRLGKPSKIMRERSGLLGELGHAIYPFEIWFYSQIDYDVYFTFVRPRATGDFELADGPESVFGTFYKGRQAFMTRSVLTREPPGQTSTYLHFLVYEDLAPIHNTFRERVYRMQEQISPGEVVDYARRHFVPEDSDHAASLDTLVPRVAYYTEGVYEALPLDLTIIRFLEASGDIRAELYYSVANEDLAFDRDARGRHTSLTGEIGIFDKDFTLVTSDSIHHFWVARQSAEGDKGVFISQWNNLMKPDKYNLHFRLENPHGNKMVVINTDFEIEPFSESELCLSDLQLARDIRLSEEPSQFKKHGLLITPLAFNAIPLGQSFYVYYEIYHLTPDVDGKTSYRVEYALLESRKKGGFLGLFGRKKESKKVFQDIVADSGEETSMSEYKMFTFDGLKEGDYSLSITVTDLNSQERAEQHLVLHLYE